jgi:hypothetical protein
MQVVPIVIPGFSAWTSRSVASLERMPPNFCAARASGCPGPPLHLPRRSNIPGAGCIADTPTAAILSFGGVMRDGSVEQRHLEPLDFLQRPVTPECPSLFSANESVLVFGGEALTRVTSVPPLDRIHARPSAHVSQLRKRPARGKLIGNGIVPASEAITLARWAGTWVPPRCSMTRNLFLQIGGHSNEGFHQVQKLRRRVSTLILAAASQG